MAECIFGFSGKEHSLKGRVQFSPLMSDNAALDTRPCRLVLSGPKASYYPIYINQEIDGRGKEGRMIGPNQYRTYNDGRPNGWKRYLQRKETWEKRTDSDKMDTILHPLLPGAVFEGKVRFHNLRPEELGALLSALTFHGNERECRHQIGMAKPYGYGKVSLELDGIDLISVGSIGDEVLAKPNDYMAMFEKYMNDKLLRSWRKSAAVSELLTIARFDVPDNSDFDYMTLDMDGHNEFNIAKGGKKQTEFPCLYLQKYSNLIRKSYNVDSLEDSSAEGLKILAQQRAAHQSDKRKRAEEEAVKAKALKEELARREKDRIEEQLRQERQKEAEEQAARRAEKAASGLTFLEEKYEIGSKAGQYKVDDSKNMLRRLNNYLKKVLKSEKLPEDQWPDLEITILRLGKNPSKEEIKKKLWIDRNSPLWKNIEKMTSKEFADKVFDLINK